MSAIFTTFAALNQLQNYMIENKQWTKPGQGSFYNTWGLAFVLIFLFLFQLIFFFVSILSAALVYGLSFQEVQNLIAEPDGTSLAINIARMTNVINFTGYMFLPSLLFTVINKTGIAAEGGLRTALSWRLIFLCILILALAIPLVDFITRFLEQVNLPQNIKHYAEYFQHRRNESINTILDMERPVELIFCIFALGLLPALFEELMFRGILLKIFKNISGKLWTPVLLQSFVFTALHFSIYEFPGIFIMGAIFGYIAIKTGTIVYGIILHFLFNSTSVVFAYLNQREFEQSGVYGKYESISISPVLAVAAIAGIFLLFRLFNRVLKEKQVYE